MHWFSLLSRSLLNKKKKVIDIFNSLIEYFRLGSWINSQWKWYVYVWGTPCSILVLEEKALVIVDRSKMWALKAHPLAFNISDVWAHELP